LLFRDGQTLAEIARSLGYDQKALYRQRDRCLDALLVSLHAAGIDRGQALEIFQSSAVSIEWEGDSRETRASRPSVRRGEQEWR
jgi:hypothetical protein